MPTTPAQNELDQQALAALETVRLDLFTAEPASITPFDSSKIRWEVKIPTEMDVSVELELDGIPVSASGEFFVTPESTTSYRLMARALSHAKILGTVTAHVDMAACVVLSAEPVNVITDVIKNQINTDPSGIRFRPPLEKTLGSFHYPVPWPPVVAIHDDRMIITLRLTKQVSHFPDPAIDIDASFALDVVPIPTPLPHDFHRLTPTNVEISVDIVFPFYVWFIPGITFPLLLAIAMEEDAARDRAAKMISDVVEALNGWFHQSYVQPPQMDKHDASFYVNPQGKQRFWITFCPAPSPPTTSDPPASSR